MAGFLSVSFDPAQISDAHSAATAALAAASDAHSDAAAAALAAASAVSAVAAHSSAWDVGASKATVASAAAVHAHSVATIGASAAAAAKARLSSAVFTDPGQGSRAVKNIVYTSAGLIKLRYSSLAQA